MPSDRAFDADLEHPWALRWRIPRVKSSYPDWKYEVALVVPTPGDTWKLDRDLIEPTEQEAAIIGSFIDYRRDWYNERWKAKMRERPFDIDSGTNTVILALTEQGWKYRRMTFEHGLWPSWNMPKKQAEYPPTAVGLVALLDHITWGVSRWAEWKTAHSSVFPPSDPAVSRGS